MAYKHKNKNAAGMMAASPMFITPNVTVKDGKARINREQSYEISKNTSGVNKNKRKTEYSDPYGFGKKNEATGQSENLQLFNTNYGKNFPVTVKNPNYNYVLKPTSSSKKASLPEVKKTIKDASSIKKPLAPGEGVLRRPGDPKPPKPQTKTVNRPNPTKTTTKSTASTSIKPMEGKASLGGDAMRASISDNISKVKATVDAARSTSNDLIKNNTSGGGRVGRVSKRQEARTARVTERLKNRRNKPQERAQIKDIRQTERTNRQMQRDKSNSTSLVPTKSASTIKNTSSQPQARLEKQTPPPVADRVFAGRSHSASKTNQRAQRAKNSVSFGNEVVGAKNMTYSQPSKPSKSNKSNRVMADKGSFDYNKKGRRALENRKYGI